MFDSYVKWWVELAHCTFKAFEKDNCQMGSRETEAASKNFLLQRQKACGDG